MRDIFTMVYKVCFVVCVFLKKVIRGNQNYACLKNTEKKKISKKHESAVLWSEQSQFLLQDNWQQMQVRSMCKDNYKYCNFSFLFYKTLIKIKEITCTLCTN